VTDELRIEIPRSQADLAATARLMADFARWAADLYREARPGLTDAYFDRAAYEKELAALPGAYAEAAGGLLLLARIGGEPVGCVGMRAFPGEPGACEMKRMYVAPERHGAGIGRALVQALLEGARSRGYRRMLLDTGPLQAAAIGLYEACGFVRVAPYYDVPPLLRESLVFMARELRAGDATA